MFVACCNRDIHVYNNVVRVDSLIVNTINRGILERGYSLIIGVLFGKVYIVGRGFRVVNVF
jgi:hypothetical protein|tara:strand:- start:6389 stop:6571 length:183 start_codon:yes stop_codon:yes gene_type:complete